MNEKNFIKLVSKIFPWLAPLPSAYFVGRSAYAHLDMPWQVALVVASIIECLGLATVHTALWLHDWNVKKRKADTPAPVMVAVVLGGIYLVATIGLTVVLEVIPSLSIIAPALFPFLAVVGAVNLALISQQEKRELDSAQDRAEKSAQRSAQRHAQTSAQHGAQSSAHNGENSPNIDAINKRRRAHKNDLLVQLLSAYQGNPHIGPTEAGNMLGVHRNTIYGYTAELEKQGRIKRNGDGIEVL